MRKNIVFFTTIVTMLLFNACSNEGLLPENNPETKHTLSLTASLPGDEPSTRVDLTQDGKNIKLTWAVGDELELVMVQNGNSTKLDNAVVYDINGNNSKFDVALPQGTTGTISLYGVYGGGGLGGDGKSDDNPTHVILPTKPSDASSLNTPDDETSVQSRKDVMLYFALEGISAANSNASVTFKHLGSLFSITVKNTSDTDLEDIYRATLQEVAEYPTNWGYNFLGINTFDLVNKEFLYSGPGYTFDYINFEVEFSVIESGNSFTFWAWFPPLSEANWPELKLELESAYPPYTIETVNTKPERTQPTLAGKAYHFHTEWDGSFLRFTNNDMIDLRDGNVYKTINIGNQVWMAENLKYLPSVVGPGIESETSPYYYVYGYNGTDVNAAKATANYNTYGVLYNWTAAMAGAASSADNPSGVQGACPTGWHLPSNDEWAQLSDHLGEFLKSGIKLKEAGTSHWTDPNTGTNESGFTALPGGSYYVNQEFSTLGGYGFWHTSTEVASPVSRIKRLRHNYDDIRSVTLTKMYGFSVRCVKN